jgi:hypothetical protein
MNSSILPKDKADLLAALMPLILAYIKELELNVLPEAYLKELTILPIVIDETLMGFWGARFRQSGAAKLATVKAFYLSPQYRGRYINKAADDLYVGLLKQGITDLEIWNHPGVQGWFERRYRVKPKIIITAEKLEKFALPHQK